MAEWEKQIAQWRRALAETIGPNANILDELESHLREELNRLVLEGQAPEQAAVLAIEKIGTAEKLGPEFAKVARSWWPIRFVLGGTFIVIAAVVGMIGRESLLNPSDPLLIVHVASVTVGYLLSYSIGVLAMVYALRRMVRDLHISQQTSWLRTLKALGLAAFILTLAGIVLGGIWANIHWGQFWNWDILEIAALLTLAWQAILLLSLFLMARKMRWLLCWAMLGNLMVTFAWFLANLLASQTSLHSYGSPPRTVLSFTALGIAHLLVMGGSIAPSGWLRLRKKTA